MFKKILLSAAFLLSVMSSSHAVTILRYTTNCPQWDNCTYSMWGVMSTMASDGSTYMGTSLGCGHFGPNICPSTGIAAHLANVPGTDITPFDLPTVDQLVDHVWSEFDAGVYAGAHSITVYNTSTGETFVYAVNWFTQFVPGTTEIEEMTYTVTKDPVDLPASGF